MNTMMRERARVTSREHSSASSEGGGLRRGGRYASVFVCWVVLSFATLPVLAQSFGESRPAQHLDLQRLRWNNRGNDGGVMEAPDGRMVSIAAASAQPRTRENNCVHPVSRISLNELFGVPEQFAHPALICDSPLTAGEPWRALWSYFGADGSNAVYPEGYTPLYPNPVDDILAKVTVEVVVDGGTSRQKTYTFFPTDADTFRTDVRIHDLNPGFPDIPSFFIIPRIAPLSPGHHTYQMIWVQSAPHCDGVSTDAEISCLPAGAFPSAVRPVDVAIP